MVLYFTKISTGGCDRGRGERDHRQGDYCDLHRLHLIDGLVRSVIELSSCLSNLWRACMSCLS